MIEFLFKSFFLTSIWRDLSLVIKSTKYILYKSGASSTNFYYIVSLSFILKVWNSSYLAHYTYYYILYSSYIIYFSKGRRGQEWDFECVLSQVLNFKNKDSSVLSLCFLSMKLFHVFRVLQLLKFLKLTLSSAPIEFGPHLIATFNFRLGEYSLVVNNGESRNTGDHCSQNFGMNIVIIH